MFERLWYKTLFYLGLHVLGHLLVVGRRLEIWPVQSLDDLVAYAGYIVACLAAGMFAFMFLAVLNKFSDTFDLS